MIKGVTCVNGSRWLSVTGSGTSYVNSTGPDSGTVRWSSVHQCLEVWNGSSWTSIGQSFVDVSLSNDTQRILDWAWKKMDEERDLSILMAKHKGIKDLKEKLDIMVALVSEENA